MSDAVRSRYWWGNALTVILFTIAVVGTIVNIAVGGAQWSAFIMVGFWFAAFAVGYPSILTLYLDVRKIRSADADFSPTPWKYLVGYIFLSPILMSLVYLHYRNKSIGLRSS